MSLISVSCVFKFDSFLGCVWFLILIKCKWKKRRVYFYYILRFKISIYAVLVMILEDLSNNHFPIKVGNYDYKLQMLYDNGKK